MKFKQDAVSEAVYKILGLVSSLLYFWACLFIVVGVTVAFLQITNEQDLTPGVVFYVVMGGTLALVGEKLRIIRNGMIKSNL